MKVLFVGPTLFGVMPDTSGLMVLPPAMQGDIAKAVLEGATVIGLVDGYFDAVAAPWHKEILYALSEGVTMLGASSMGALRAAECASFGMRPIGSIAMAYASGTLDDDAAVALSHGPAELGYPPLTEPLVNVAPTLRLLQELGLISAAEHAALSTRAGQLHFKDRTDDTLFAATTDSEALVAYRKYRVNRKAEDALELVEELKRLPDIRTSPSGWTIPSTLFEKQVLPGLVKASSAT